MSTVVKVVETDAKEVTVVRGEGLPGFLYRDMLTLGQDFAWRQARSDTKAAKVEGDFVFVLDCNLSPDGPVFQLTFGSMCSVDVSSFALYDHVAQVLEVLKNQERR